MRKATASGIHPARAAADRDYIPHLATAATLLEKAQLELRLFECVFNDDDSPPRLSAKELAKRAELILELLAQATGEVFTRTCQESTFAMTNKVLDQLRDAIDVVSVCASSLAAGAFGDGRSVTSYPVQGAMALANQQLTKPRATLDRYLASLPRSRSNSGRKTSEATISA